MWILAPACAYSGELRQSRQGDRQDALRPFVGQFAADVVDLDDDLALASLVPALAETNEIVGAGHGRVLAAGHLHGFLVGLPEGAVFVVETGGDGERHHRDVVAVAVIDLRVLAAVAAGALHLGPVGHG